MNKDLLDLLSKCKIAKIPQLINNEKSFIIKKSEIPNLIVDHCYRICILSLDKVIDVEIQKYDNDKVYCFSPSWESWIDITDIKVIQEL